MHLFSTQKRLDKRYRIDSAAARFHLAGQGQKVKPKVLKPMLGSTVSPEYLPAARGYSTRFAI